MTEPTELEPDDTDLLWLSITELARAKGVDKSQISRKVGEIEGKIGRPITRPGKGVEKLVNVAEYDTAVGSVTDFSHELGAETARANREADWGDTRMRDAKTKTAQLEAALKGIELRKQTGALVDITRVNEVIAEVAEEIKKPLDQVALRADDIAAAAISGGPPAVRTLLGQIVFDLRAKIADALRKIDVRSQSEGAA